MTTATDYELALTYVGDPHPKCSTRWWNSKTGKLEWECGADATHLVTAHANVGDTHDTKIEPMCEMCLNTAMFVYCPVHKCEVIIAWQPL